MGGGGPDPYDNILAVCQQLNAIQPVTVAPIPLQTVRLGTFDASTGTFTWNAALPLETTEEEIPPDLAEGHKQPTVVNTTVYHFAPVAITIRLSVDLVNNASGSTFTIGDQTAFSPPAGTDVSIEGPFGGPLFFVLTSGNHRAGGRVDATHITNFGINADRSHFVNASGSLQDAGCVVVPALPIGIAYQPPAKNAVGEFNEAQSTGALITNISISGSGSGAPSSSFSEINVAVEALQTIAALAGFAGEYGAAVKAVASVLATFLEKIQSASPAVRAQVNNPQTLTFTFTQEATYSSARDLGSGAGDVIIYLQDATFAVYALNGKTTVVPLGHRGLIPTPVPAASLQSGAVQPANLPADIRALLLALDPVASGNPEGVTDKSRYSYVGELTLPFSGTFSTPVKFCSSVSQVVSTGGSKLITWTNEKGQVVDVTLGSSIGASRGSTVRTCLDVTEGPVDFEIWYDSLFDVFAYRDLLHMQTSAVSFEGTLPASDLPPLGQEVTVVQNGQRVTTFTDAQGHYLLRSPSMQPGPAQLLLPSSAGSPITQAINLSV